MTTSGRTFSHQEGVAAYCQRLIKTVQPDCIILHGSVARGVDDKDSDVDLLVIGGKLPDNFFERLYLLNRLREDDTPIEAVGYSLPEWEKMMQNLHLTTLEALEWGVPLYGESLFYEWRTRFESFKRQGLSRGKNSWTVPAALRRKLAA